MGYEFKIDIFPVNANKVGNYFEDLQDKFGEINPEFLVENARDEGSLLHDCFEWNDSIAAESYRVEQAKNLIRTLVKIEKTGNSETVTRAVVSVRLSECDTRRYCMTSVVMKNDYAREMLLREALRDCKAFEDRYKSLEEVRSVIEAIGNLNAK